MGAGRAGILAALRPAVLRRPPYGPAGGLPGMVRIDHDRRTDIAIVFVGGGDCSIATSRVRSAAS
ncbi:hypothetical protein AB0M45_06150 [Nocardia sp. NPDC051787]|uniref:hypothetical protein n=1 Tax=Nocardia sp. NPDC051787 TaxID=3155415 RepID=UPI003413CE43